MEGTQTTRWLSNPYIVSCGTQRIDLIDEDNRWRVQLCFLKYLLQLPTDGWIPNQERPRLHMKEQPWLPSRHRTGWQSQAHAQLHNTHPSPEQLPGQSVSFLCREARAAAVHAAVVSLEPSHTCPGVQCCHSHLDCLPRRAYFSGYSSAFSTMVWIRASSTLSPPIAAYLGFPNSTLSTLGCNSHSSETSPDVGRQWQSHLFLDTDVA